VADPTVDALRRRVGRRAVLVHDWLTGMRGGERVLEAFCRLFPDAPILTLVHARGPLSDTIARHRIRTSPLQWLPRATRAYRQYLPLMPAAIEGFDLDEADLVISTSHCAAKSVVVPGRALHVCYCHSPMRYGWDQFPAYFGRERVGPLGHRALRHVMAHLARWDRATAGRVDEYIANSAFVAARIGRYYNRSASVLHPPVDTEFFTPGGQTEAYFLVVSALVPYKRIEVAIEAASRVQVPLRIVGSGPERPRLQAKAGADITFMGTVPDTVLRDLYRGALAVILPGEEDFGIVPVEAMACGRPVVAAGRGGARETVLDGRTGLLVDGDSPADFADALRDVQRMPVDAQALHAHAQTFSTERFEARSADLLAELLELRPAC